MKNTTLTVTGSSTDLQVRTSVQGGAFILDGTPLTTGESVEVSLKNASHELVGEATAQKRPIKVGRDAKNRSPRPKYYST